MPTSTHTPSTTPCASSSAFARLCRLPLGAIVLAGIWAGMGGARVGADEWGQFLGKDRNGISDETGLVRDWPADGLPVLWRTPGGVGMSGIAVQQGNAITLVQREGKQRVLCLDLASGQPKWETAVAPAYENSMGDGPRATPTIHDDRVYVFTGEGVLAALQLKDGEPAWSVNAVQDLGGRAADYGMACSPLVVPGPDGPLVVVTVGAAEGTVAAYDAATGRRAWQVGQDRAGYSSPRLTRIGDAPVILVFSGESLLGVSPNGKLLWRYPYPTDYDCNIAAPLVTADGVFISAGENHGCELLEVKRAEGAYKLQPVWSSFGSKSVMRNEWQTSILLDGHLYGFDNVGSAGPVTHFNCVELATGKRVWQKTRFGKGNLIAADGKLFVSTMDGELVVLKATPDGFQELGRQQLLGSTRQAPALADGKLLLRDNREIVCVDARAR